jgi:hypothetical protein
VSKLHSTRIKALHPHTVFSIFKYTIYALLAFNVYLFFREDFLASQQVFGNPLVWDQIVEAFSATIDTGAWVVLLLLFELETAVIDDDKLRGGLKWVLMGIRIVAYAFIVWAFFGYLTKYGVITDTIPFVVNELCDLVGTSYSWVADLDEYPAIDQAACQALQGQSLVQLNGTHIIGTEAAVEAARGLAIVDIINAADWLLIVMLLEIEVYMQLKDMLTKRGMFITKYTKGLLYVILFLCATYWGFLGDFLDFWDAFLWLVAFIIIEMNIFQWHEELEEEKAELAG